MKVLLIQSRGQTGMGLNGFIVTKPPGLALVAASLEPHEVRIGDGRQHPIDS